MFSIKLIIIWAILVAVKPTRKFALALTPWLVFACSYDGMRLLPNYEVNRSEEHTSELQSPQ